MAALGDPDSNVSTQAIKALGSISEAEVLTKLELARQQIGEEYANASQRYIHPMEAEGLDNYFGVPLETIDRAIAEIRARSTAQGQLDKGCPYLIARTGSAAEEGCRYVPE